MAFVTKARWRDRTWRSERLDLVAGQAEARLVAWGAAVRKRLLAPVSAHASIGRGHRFDLDASSRLEWTTADDLAPFETEPGELAHLAEGGAHVSCLRLSRMPDECVWRHELELPGVRLTYQPPLTAAEISEGCTRPPAVVGSYAAFALDDGRKVAHILRPVAVDGHGNRVWGTIRIADGISTVRFDPAALRSLAWGGDGIAIYGLDTFGYTSVGGSSGTLVQDYDIAHKCPTAPDSDGTVTAIWAYVDPAGGDAVVVVGIWDHDAANNLPENLLGSSVGLWTNPLGWKEESVSASVTASTQYWLGWNTESRAVVAYYDAGTRYVYHARTYDGTLPDPFGNSINGSGARDYSIYATYTPTGGGLSIPVAMDHYRRRRP